MYKVVGAVGTVENCDRALGRGRSFPSTVGTVGTLFLKKSLAV